MGSEPRTSKASNGSPPDTTVCVFAWNEAGTTDGFVRSVARELEGMGRSFEVLLIDDGSTDGTEAIADQLAREVPGVRVVHHTENRGLGGVYRTGFDEARGDFVTFFPADGQFAAALLRDLRTHAEGQDLVLGYLPRRTDVVGKTLSGIERVLYRALVGKMPRFQGVFMLRRSVLASTRLHSHGRGWGIVMEMILRVHRKGYRVISIPTTVRPRTHGHSKVNNLRNIRANVAQLVTLRSILRKE